MDSEDWQRPGVARIVANATPAGDTSAVILFHDAGGDRAQTVEALRMFIPAMKARGYRFTTVTEGLNVGLSEQRRSPRGWRRPRAAPVVPAQLALNAPAARGRRVAGQRAALDRAAGRRPGLR